MGCVAPTGLPFRSLLTQGSGCFAASTLGFAMSRFQRYLESKMVAIPLLQPTNQCRLSRDTIEMPKIVGIFDIGFSPDLLQYVFSR